MLDITQIEANSKCYDHNTDSTAKTQQTGHRKIMEYPNSTLP